MRPSAQEIKDFLPKCPFACSVPGPLAEWPHDELKTPAAGHMRREGRVRPLETTALVHAFAASADTKIPAASYDLSELDRQIRLTRQLQLELPLIDAIDRRYGHIPRIDQVRSESAVLRKLEVVQRGLVIVEIVK